MTSKPRYPIVVFWSDRDRCWIADVPDLKSCSAHGETEDEALAEVKIAMDAWLAVAREKGYEVPPPTWRLEKSAA